MPAHFQAVFLCADVALAVGVALALAVRVRARAVGDVVQRELPGLRGRLFGVGLVAAALIAAVLGSDQVPLPWSLSTLALTLAFVLLRPADGDRVCGRDGVRRGWYVRRLADLEEWRLTGDHLRFRLRGEWTAVGLANAHHAEFETKLRAAAPDRESPFQ